MCKCKFFLGKIILFLVLNYFYKILLGEYLVNNNNKKMNKYIRRLDKKNKNYRIEI